MRRKFIGRKPKKAKIASTRQATPSTSVDPEDDPQYSPEHDKTTSTDEETDPDLVKETFEEVTMPASEVITQSLEDGLMTIGEKRYTRKRTKLLMQKPPYLPQVAYPSSSHPVSTTSTTTLPISTPRVATTVA